ncbi:hypothetical protein E1A91_A05G383900v1 [Gossypium mustelinum]|uniref:Uncharacterized protein n=1 Tax=Gossypium mustelinum TaxID=34275 RepID=A0A5D2ZES8_GOSMU|nr:hypothetical protein E1A91_A05G383900v1 [Gossypium mustelinum]
MRKLIGFLLSDRSKGVNGGRLPFWCKDRVGADPRATCALRAHMVADMGGTWEAQRKGLFSLGQNLALYHLNHLCPSPARDGNWVALLHFFNPISYVTTFLFTFFKGKLLK